MLNLRPLADHVIVEAVEVEEKTASGIFLPDTAVKEKPQQGKVLAVGAGKYTDNGVLLKPSVKVGDEVMTSSGFYGKVVELEGEDIAVVEFGTNRGVRIPVNKSEIIGNKNATAKTEK